MALSASSSFPATLVALDVRNRLTVRAAIAPGDHLQITIALAPAARGTSVTLTIAVWTDPHTPPHPIDTRFVLDSLWRLRDALASAPDRP
jgi:hypothetical protein